MNRNEILELATALVSNDREIIYGPPQRNLTCAGELLAVYQKYTVLGRYPLGHDIAMQQVLVKIARIATLPEGGTFRIDNYVDGAGYLALAAELLTEPR